jgi:Ca-activated chloride channel family protein
MGGTNIYDPLKSIFDTFQTGKSKAIKHLLILTDGAVEDSGNVLLLVSSHASDARIFSFGVGSDVSKDFIKGLARASGGRSEFIANGGKLESKANHYLKKVLIQGNPLMRDVKIDWGSILTML